MLRIVRNIEHFNTLIVVVCVFLKSKINVRVCFAPFQFIDFMKKGILLALLFAYSFAHAQEAYYTDPMKIPLLLSGSFAELRSNHFHSGIDIKTQGVTGLPVFAVADGFISRIVVSPTGYGNALYIDHPNGTTTVYGHLERFAPAIQNYVKDQQYAKQSFRVDLEVPSNFFPVKKGEEVAKSGNSGSSGGPHLHFEVRDTKSEEPLNPLEFGFSVTDNIAPKFFNLLVVPLTDTSQVDNQYTSKSYPVVFYDGKYFLKSNPVIPVYGKVGFAVQVNDYFDGTYNKCGINELTFSADGENQFVFRLNRFAFDESRYINSHIVYSEYANTGSRFVKTWIDPGNRLPIYNYNLSQGIYEAASGKHKIEIEIADSYGNSSVLDFQVEKNHSDIPREESAEVIEMHYNQENLFESSECCLEIPKGAFYKDFDFMYSTRPTTDAFLSDFQLVGTKEIPLHKAASLRVKPRNLPVGLESKVVMVNVDSRSGKPSAAGGQFRDGWVETDIRTLGTYAVMVDTIPPTISSLSIANETLTESNRIRFTINDELSGIKSYEGLLDGQWALFDYDPRISRITHYFDKERFELGKRHTFKLTVTDYRDNKTVYETTFWK